MIYVQAAKYTASIKQQRHQNDTNDIVFLTLLSALNGFDTLFWFSIVDFEQANAYWVGEG